jgi:hypothetical protein
VIDALGYGTLATSTYVETAPAAVPTGDGGLRRVVSGADTDDNSVDFAIVTNANISLRNSLAFPLPVRFTNIKAYQRPGGIQVEWSNTTETDVTSYSVERSANGRQFASIAQKAAARNDGGKADYQVLDATSLAGDNFYRIKAVEGDGKITYSSIVRINTSRNGAYGLQVYPNPVKGGELSLQFSNLPAGTYGIRVYNNAGQLVQQRSYSHAGGSATQPLVLSSFRSGIYHVQVSGKTDLKVAFVIE